MHMLTQIPLVKKPNAQVKLRDEVKKQTQITQKQTQDHKPFLNEKNT